MMMMMMMRRRRRRRIMVSVVMLETLMEIFVAMRVMVAVQVVMNSGDDESAMCFELFLL